MHQYQPQPSPYRDNLADPVPLDPPNRTILRVGEITTTITTHPEDRPSWRPLRSCTISVALLVDTGRESAVTASVGAVLNYTPGQHAYPAKWSCNLYGGADDVTAMARAIDQCLPPLEDIQDLLTLPQTKGPYSLREISDSAEATDRQRAVDEWREFVRFVEARQLVDTYEKQHPVPQPEVIDEIPDEPAQP